MKLLNRIILFTLCFIIFSCKKENDHGNVLVTVKYNRQIVDQLMVYMKGETLTNSNIPLTTYDKSMSGDATGQVTFEDLASGDYFFHTQAYSNTKSNYLLSDGHITVKSRSRENFHTPTIDCN